MLSTAQVTSLYAAAKIKPADRRSTYQGLQLMIWLVGLGLLTLTVILVLLSRVEGIHVSWLWWTPLVLVWIAFIIWGLLLSIMIRALKIVEADSPVVREYLTFLEYAHSQDAAWVEANLT